MVCARSVPVCRTPSDERCRRAEKQGLLQVRSKPIARFIVSLFGSHASRVSFRDEELKVCAKSEHVIHLGQLKSAPTTRKGLMGTTLTIQADDMPEYRLKGARNSEAQSFAAAVRAAWIDYNTRMFQSERAKIDWLLAAIVKFDDPVRYPAACSVSPLLEMARKLDNRLLSKLPREATEDCTHGQIKTIQTFVENAWTLRVAAITRFEQHQMEEWSTFFDTFENNPLTTEQRRSIIADEDATLVLAGAGSGKTSVITAKAGYLLKSGIRKPEEILLLAYAKDAAREMSNRIKEKCHETLEARTFHALAYNIIGEVEGRKPALAAHATDDKAFLALIREILRELVQTSDEVSRSIIRWFSYNRLDDKSEWDFKKKHDYYTLVEKSDLRTLQGEQVKSFEELMIANWLYENGVDYEYEPNYEHQVSEGGYKDYCPDFRLKKSGVYIEHFGVRRKKADDGTFQYTTAPFVDHEHYLAGMEWKRRVHQEHDTTLVETFSYEREEGRLLDALAEKIATYEKLVPRAPEVLFDRVVELQQADSFVQLIGTFLRHYKGGGYQISACVEKGERLKLGKRAKAFLAIFEPVHAEYHRQLDGRIDFEDMILQASDYVESGVYISPFKHILVDEFQDISRSRGRLVKALKAQHSDARLYAVGDDWQSIYRFAGADISLMRNFGAEFGGAFDGKTGVHTTVDLGRTFRSVDQIAHAAKRFVLQNPAQLNKTVVPAGVADAPALKVVATFKNDADRKLLQVLQSLSAHTDGLNQATVLLLGRYRYLEPLRLSHLRRQFPHLNITFRTIHSSKGLEADHVIVLGLFRGRTGFPSEIVDDRLLSLVSPDAEPFDNAEERRVMYVAFTRARQTVTLMAAASKPSVFVQELLEDPEYGVVDSGEGQKDNHICGECGGHLLVFPAEDGCIRYKCEHTELCGFSVNACSVCGNGLPVKQNGSKMKTCACGMEYQGCPECEHGWLVEKKSRFGPFLGCVNYPRCRGKMKLSRVRASS